MFLNHLDFEAFILRSKKQTAKKKQTNKPIHKPIHNIQDKTPTEF